LGCHLRFLLEQEGAAFVATDAEVDITDKDGLFRFAAPHRLSVIFNCAAFTDVRACEVRTEEAFQVNAEGVRNLAQVAAWKGARLVHVSTDYVFDGTADAPYPENAPTAPLNAYGQSKLAGERYLRAAHCPWTLVRTSWLFGKGGRNFVTSVLERLREKGVIQVVSDQYGSPTYAGDLACALLSLAQAAPGIYHVANFGVTSWFGFACRIAELGVQLGLVPEGARVEPIRSKDLNDPVTRPAYSALDTRKAAQVLGWSPRPWEKALREFLEELREAPVG